MKTELVQTLTATDRFVDFNKSMITIFNTRQHAMQSESAISNEHVTCEPRQRVQKLHMFGAQRSS